MINNQFLEGQIEKLDNSVPIFNPKVGNYQYEDGTIFECENLSWNKLSKDLEFKGLHISQENEDSE